MLFFTCCMLVQPIGKGFDTSLQTHSTRILNQHVLSTLNQSLPGYKALYSLHSTYRLLLTYKGLLSKTKNIQANMRINKQTTMHTLSENYFS